MKAGMHNSKSRRASMARTPGPWLKVLGVLVVGVLFFGAGSVGMMADRSAGASIVTDTAGWPSGQVTDKQTNAIRIDGRAYSLHTKLSIMNDEGTPVAWSAVAVGSWVKFHLKGGRIDHLVLVLPK